MRTNPLEYVSAVAVWLRDHDYFSKTKASEAGVLPTSTTVYDQLDVLAVRITPEDRARARRALDWAVNWNPVNASERDAEFRARLQDVVRKGRVTRKTVGFLACLITSSERDAERQVKKAAREQEEQTNRESSTSQYVGTEGDRISGVWVLVEKVFQYESRYGTKDVHKLKLDDNAMTWWATNGTRLEEGMWYRVSFAVKSHKEYRGVCETTVTRLKVVEGPTRRWQDGSSIAVEELEMQAMEVRYDREQSIREEEAKFEARKQMESSSFLQLAERLAGGRR